MRVLGQKTAGVAGAGGPALHPAHLPDRLAELRRLRKPVIPGFTARVRHLIVVASSSRGGSSMLAELLRHSPDLLHLRAESSPFLRLVGLGYGGSAGDSDVLTAQQFRDLSPTARTILDQELALDAGRPARFVDDDEQFLLDVVWRLTVQWPSVALDVQDTLTVLRGVLRELRARHSWQPGEVRDPALLLVTALNRLRAAYPRLDPRLYDLPASALDRVARPGGAADPGPVLIEEPPFIVPQVWRRADAGDLETKALVIKAPSNAYRMDFLRAMFPAASIRVIHLTRNPAAAINGLCDGWLYDGFHAQRTAQPLRIGGYADVRPEQRWWWKFDLPPGWHEYADAPLLQVCAFQWRSCHRAILDETARRPSDHLRVGFEDLLRGADAREAAVRRLAVWLGIPLHQGLRRATRHGIEPVAATRPPAPRRWLGRQQEIRSAIGPEIHDIAKELGYGADDSWI